MCAEIPSVRTADCVPLLLGVRGGRAAAAVHAGWRGTAAGVVEAALAALTRAAGCAPDRVVAGLGPAIGACCYQVGPEVAAGVGSEGAVERRADGLYLDLRTAVRERLLAGGVPARAITSAPWCTRCRADLFYSFRGEGDRAGRLMASIGPLTASAR